VTPILRITPAPGCFKGRGYVVAPQAAVTQPAFTGSGIGNLAARSLSPGCGGSSRGSAGCDPRCHGVDRGTAALAAPSLGEQVVARRAEGERDGVLAPVEGHHFDPVVAADLSHERVVDVAPEVKLRRSA
jgi:hypothetical protein